MHRSWIYKLLARYRTEGDAGLVARSRRPRTSPTQVAAEVDERIVALRRQLSDEGLDAGPQTIHWHLSRRGGPVPSVSTIRRILQRRGFVIPQPRKRPRSSYTRFEAELPNQCWQSDMTHWALADGTDIEIVNFLDDHSRLCVSSVAFTVTRATDIAAVFTAAASRLGIPTSVLTDNGAIYTGRYRGGRVAMEITLEALGVTYKHSSPYHPQTCGKVERFHQTLKHYLAKQDPAATIGELQAQLDRFATYYNTRRPHRALGRRTPQEVFDTKLKARPPVPSDVTHFRVGHDKIDKTGRVTLRYRSRLRHIGLGRRHAGTAVLLLVADRDIRVITTDGELLRHLTIDPTRDYQPINNT